jgi:ferredoxin-fold anticodon binding domain-containing protein
MITKKQTEEVLSNFISKENGLHNVLSNIVYVKILPKASP